MKKTLIFTLFLVHTIALSAQYKVLWAPHGFLVNQQQLQTGMSLDSTATIQFADSVAEGRPLICQNGLRFYELKPELLIVGAVCEAKTPVQIGESRGFQRKDQAIADLAAFFGQSLFSIVGDSVPLPLDETAYPLSDQKFIVFSYKIGSERQAKRIAYTGQTLWINRRELAQGKTVRSEMTFFKDLNVYLYEPETQSRKKICAFNLQFVPQDEILHECKTILEANQNSASAKEILPKYINYRFGQLIPKQLNQILSNF